MLIRLYPRSPYSFLDRLGHPLTLNQAANDAIQPNSILEIVLPGDTDFSARDLTDAITGLSHIVSQSRREPLSVLLYVPPAATQD